MDSIDSLNEEFMTFLKMKGAKEIVVNLFFV